LKLLHACDRQHSARLSTATHRCHHKLHPHAEGQSSNCPSCQGGSPTERTKCATTKVS
jgi:hypothetical protein